MILSYKSLLRVELRHAFYREGRSLSDFRVKPTPATRCLLEERGLGFRAEPDRFVVYAQVVPESSPPKLQRAVGGENLVLRFLLQPLHPYLFNISDLGHYRMGRELFCFDNLRDDQQDDRLYLGDAVANARLGPAVALQTSSILDYPFDPAIGSAQLTLFNRFGRQLDSKAVTAPPGAGTLDSLRYDLSKVDGMTPGRYRIQDDQGGEKSFYFDPDLFGDNAFGVIELFVRTDQLDPNGIDRVPADYRFLDADQLTGPEAFTLQLQQRSTHWRYIVSKQYDNNSITLAQLAITGPVAFDRVDGDKQVVFTAQDSLPLAEAQQKITLAHNGTELRSLPNPSLASPLEGSKAEGLKYSDIYVYV